MVHRFSYRLVALPVFLIACLSAAPSRFGAVSLAIDVSDKFQVDEIARIPGARELAPLPNGDLLVGTKGRDVFLLAGAESAKPQRATVFATAPDDEAAGIAFSRRRNLIFIATQHAVFTTAYASGRRTAEPLRKIAAIRTGPVAPYSDGDVHTTTSVAYADATDTLYVAVGSSCNACVEADPTRASIFSMRSVNGELTKRATRIRNAIALTVEPRTGALWAGDAGQDDLPSGHPYEFLDDVTAHSGIADYGWPQCEENERSYIAGANCSHTVAPDVELPAYSTIIGAAFYPDNPSGRFAFPRAYRGGLFATTHGSWHRTRSGAYAATPQVVFVPMKGGRPATPVDWSDPTTQWRTFADGFQRGLQRVGRPTGVAVGTQGSLFIADDTAGAIYRVRPVSR